MLVCSCGATIGELIGGAAAVDFLGAFIVGAVVNVVGNAVYKSVEAYSRSRRRSATSS
ncbi:hypothetical protein NE236_29490 [Actinoallomurus purpureus]|uniref:hypothetical protein n=1 Tax=Actinoallomurus purpureus TaxID=478114 RepID=UPI002093B422|nr:hypothetical protein [Actinoallomurus purpureus]MCO6009116.1 hypothetical protein [Actinoallomurus purpureus]